MRGSALAPVLSRSCAHGTRTRSGLTPGGGCLLGGSGAVWVWPGLLGSAGGDDGGALGVGGGVFSDGEDVPGDVGAGDGLDGDPVAGLNVPGQRAVGQLDGPHGVPVEPAGG